MTKNILVWVLISSPKFWGNESQGSHSNSGPSSEEKRTFSAMKKGKKGHFLHEKKEKEGYFRYKKGQKRKFDWQKRGKQIPSASLPQESHLIVPTQNI